MRREKIEESSGSKVKLLFFLGVAVVIVFIIIFLSAAIKRKFMSVNDRIREVNELCTTNENLFNRLSNYTGPAYTVKFVEYLEFLVENAPIVRDDLRVIFKEKPGFKVKSRNLLLSAGRTKKSYYKILKKVNKEISLYYLYSNIRFRWIRRG